jgi:hypothetical protein
VNYTLTLTPEQIQVVWAGLMELPGKTAFPTSVAVKIQIEQQEAAAKTPAPAPIPELPKE